MSKKSLGFIIAETAKDCWCVDKKSTGWIGTFRTKKLAMQFVKKEMRYGQVHR